MRFSLVALFAAAVASAAPVTPAAEGSNAAQPAAEPAAHPAAEPAPVGMYIPKSFRIQRQL